MESVSDKKLSLTKPVNFDPSQRPRRQDLKVFAWQVVIISRPRVARAGTNKLKCQKNIPTGSHLTQMSAGVPNLDDFLNLNNFGQNGQN